MDIRMKGTGDMAQLTVDPVTGALLVTAIENAIYENNVPISGSTFVMEDSARNGGYWASATGTLAQLTVTLPSDAKSVIGESRYIGTSKAISQLIVNGATTIFNVPSSLNAGDLIFLRKVAPNTWSKAV